MTDSRTIILVVVLALTGCDSDAEALRVQLAEAEAHEVELRAQVLSLERELAPIREREAERDREAQAAERVDNEAAAERERAWASIRGSYRCTGGAITGIIIRDGHARMQMGGLEALSGNQSYPAQVRGGTLYITDRQRGTVGWAIRDGGNTLVPESTIYARRCTRRGQGATSESASDE